MFLKKKWKRIYEIFSVPNNKKHTGGFQNTPLFVFWTLKLYKKGWKKNKNLISMGVSNFLLKTDSYP